MKVEKANITRLTITEVPSLDPVRVMLENYEPGKGRITIQCWDKSWTSYWGGMSGRSVEQFFVDCTNDYLIGYLCTGLEPTKFCGEALHKLALKTIIERRRPRNGATAHHDIGPLDKDAARDLWREAGDLEFIQGPDGCWNQSRCMELIFGPEWYYWIDRKADAPNPKYEYLERICDAVRDGLRVHLAGNAEGSNG